MLDSPVDYGLSAFRTSVLQDTFVVVGIRIGFVIRELLLMFSNLLLQSIQLFCICGPFRCLGSFGSQRFCRIFRGGLSAFNKSFF